MAPEYDPSDRHGLMQLAMIVNDFWSADDAKARREAAQEIRLQSARFGTSPMDRRRLQWQIVETEDKQRRARHRSAREAEQQSPTTASGGGQRPPRDPRAMLRSVPTDEPS